MTHSAVQWQRLFIRVATWTNLSLITRMNGIHTIPEEVARFSLCNIYKAHILYISRKKTEVAKGTAKEEEEKE